MPVQIWLCSNNVETQLILAILQNYAAEFIIELLIFFLKTNKWLNVMLINLIIKFIINIIFLHFLLNFFKNNICSLIAYWKHASVKT